MIPTASHATTATVSLGGDSTREALEIPADALSLEGFRAWYAALDVGAGVQASWVDGMLFVQTSPQNYPRHAPVVSSVNFELETVTRREDRGKYFVPPSWVTESAAGLSTEPDGFVVRWESFRTGRVRVNPDRDSELLGAPDWAFEVVSPSSRKKDLVKLRRSYAKAGVSEYWVVDPDVEPLALSVLVLAGDAYVEQPRDAEGWTASPFWGRSFRLVPFVNAGGLPDARLELRPGS